MNFENLSLTWTERPPYSVLTLKGELESVNYILVRKAVAEWVHERMTKTGSQRPASSLVIDLEQITYIDSVGLNSLVDILRNFRKNELDLALVCTDGRAFDALELTGCDRLFNIVPSIDALLASNE